MASSKAPISVAVIGVGLVGSAFLKQLALPALAPHVRLVYASSSKRELYSASGIQASELSNSTAAPSLDGLLQRLTALGGRAVVVDNTSDERVAQFYPKFLNAGISVVTPNKKAFSGPLALYQQIVSAPPPARALHESTVGAGLPIIQTLNDLVQTADKVLRIEGVLSGTLSYIFNEFSPAANASSAPPFSQIVKEAREKGYTEPHPADDLSGSDVARKLTILSRLVPELVTALPEGYLSVSVSSLVPDALKDIKTGDEFVQRLPEFDEYFSGLRSEAEKEGKVLRYVGVVDVEKGVVRAALEKYSATHAFATALGGSDNIIAFHTQRYSPRPLLVQGAGAGADVTAMGVMSDLLKLLR
ncbi:aspartate kinase homoserine dehydrogenase [Auricularia subglabra TFB-10046 SS5]|uniref:Homoserine dehydrogenase n=1 Tax=Auricularia subglabra (strain TFB-10046 / SS5) TaxID=717982 RepID=J0WWN3_AURST|nr:aspartate kinase homoserine dehydrogenase [Auricularia subglabra TFB-10046 SS5]